MTRLLYISVGLCTRQDTISYSFIYIVQKLENWGLGNWGPGNWDWDRETGDCGTRTGNRDRKTGTVELGNWGSGPWNSDWKPGP